MPPPPAPTSALDPSARAMAIAAASSAALNAAPGQRDRAIEEAAKAVGSEIIHANFRLLTTALTFYRPSQNTNSTKRMVTNLLLSPLKQDLLPHTSLLNGAAPHLESLFRLKHYEMVHCSRIGP